MSLQEYRRKRRFDRTREPEPGRRVQAARRPIFVVQLHHASHRHYDFRLQVDGVLKSWAVPKGPSFDPTVKRLAVEVEDHPLAYAGFEGEIPKGQYGGGHVAIFDSGTWTTEDDPAAQLAKGHLRFELFGQRLRGGWHLVRSGRPDAKKPQWLLFKDADAHAGQVEADDLLDTPAAAPARRRSRATSPQGVKTASDVASEALSKSASRTVSKRSTKATKAPPAGRTRKAEAADGKQGRWAKAASDLPGARRVSLADQPFEFQLATAEPSPPTGEDWIHEIKWDGYRIGAVVHRGRARLWSRNALEWTHRVPEAVAAIESLGLDTAAFDGELIAGSGRRGDFNRLQATLSGERQGALSLVLFDLLHVDGVDIAAAPLVERKALLARLLASPPPHLSYSVHVDAAGKAALALASDDGFEGLISKRADQPYRAGRSRDWRKSKRLDSEEFAVVGYTPPKGRRAGFGALLLARPEEQGRFVYAGRVGSGFSDENLRQLAARIGKRGDATPSVPVPPNDTDLRAARWFAPEFVVEVFHRGIGGHGLLRQPSLKAIRLDKSPEDLVASDVAAPANGPVKAPAKARAKAAAGRRAPSARDTETGIDAIVLTHPDRVVFAEGRRTKRDVFEYYRAMSDWILPEIGDRPLSIVRCPQGAERPCFFQKHHTAGLEHAEAMRLVEDDGDEADYLVVRDAVSLLELVQFNALEFHPWGARADAPDIADSMVFDLDPGEGVPWADIVDAARRIRGWLDDVGLASFVRTSGGKGLHVVVPLAPGCGWDITRGFARAFAESLVAMAPLRFVASASKRLRKGKIFVDYLRNGRGATSVASFSLRARPGAPVAMPLRWEELGRVQGAAHFDIDSASRRMRRMRSHPWGDWRARRQDLDQAMAVLAR